MSKFTKRKILIGSASAYLSLCLFLFSCGNEEDGVNNESRSKDLGDNRLDEYVGAATCAECHAEAHAKWEESHHYHAMEIPGPGTVRADFNNTEFVHYGITTKFFMDGEK